MAAMFVLIVENFLNGKPTSWNILKDNMLKPLVIIVTYVVNSVKLKMLSGPIDIENTRIKSIFE